MTVAARPGFSARPENYIGESMSIHYAVAAGLGQLGLNGQLLSPHAGSRCRINVIHTDAPLPLDEPIDYGLEGVCDRCQACVRRRPAGAIPAHRREHRGVVKAKLNTQRCLPIVTQAAGCSVHEGLPGPGLRAARGARGVRPVGRDPRDAHRRARGLRLALDGKHYPPGSTPKVPDEVVRPEGYAFDPDRRDPPEGSFPVLGG